MLSRKSISSPLWGQIAAETALQSQNTQTPTDGIVPLLNTTPAAGGSPLSPSWSIQLLALDFTLSSQYYRCVEHQRKALEVTSESFAVKICQCVSVLQSRCCEELREIRSDGYRYSPSKHRTSESILSLYPAGALQHLSFSWRGEKKKKKKKVELLEGAHVSAIDKWKVWD